MSKSPLVSIITPVSDRHEFIEECIESVLSQTFSDWEQIIVDDSIGEKVREVVRKYLDDERVRYFKQEHIGIKGLGVTYNKALGLSRGKFIAVLEDDDFWPSDKLEEQLKLFSDEETVLTWGKVKLVDSDSKIIGNYPSAWEHFSEDVLCNRPVGRILKTLLLNIPMGPGVTIMIRKQPLLEIGGFWQPEEACCVDNPTWLKMSLQGSFAYSQKTLGYWRIHKNQVSSTLVRNSRGMAGKAFWDTLTQKEKEQFGIENLGRVVNSKFWLIRGHHAIANGDYGREFLSRVIVEGCGVFRLKATLILVGFVVAPWLMQSKLSSPLPFFLWLKEKVKTIFV